MFKIVASDLDGTLLKSDHQLTLFAIKIIRLLINTEVHFIFATGRHYMNVLPIYKKLKVRDYMITSNGAKIHDSEGKLIASYDFSIETAFNLLCVAHNNINIVTNVFRNDEWLVNRVALYPELFFQQGYDFNYNVYKKNLLPLNSINKIYFTSHCHKSLFLLEKELNIRWGNSINVSFSLPTCLEVVPLGVSKGHALKKVAGLLGYQLRDCIAFGDGMNDKEMLSMAGKGCIMRNAQQRLKDLLPFLEVIGCNEDDAVSHYLNCIYFNNYYKNTDNND